MRVIPPIASEVGRKATAKPVVFAFLVGMATNIYIDSFNLYYGSLRGTSLKWLNLGEMCRRLLPHRDINRIRFFTAHVNALPHDKQAPARQDI